MAKHIDADTLWKNLTTQFDETLSLSDVGEVIEKLPTADVLENVHGTNISDNRFVCSACGWDSELYYPIEFKWCPNCGAKIEGSE